MSAINDSPEYADCELTLLWHSLVLMAPQPKGKRTYDPDHDAWCFVKFARTGAGRTLCELHIDSRALGVINGPASTPDEQGRPRTR